MMSKRGKIGKERLTVQIAGWLWFSIRPPVALGAVGRDELILQIIFVIARTFGDDPGDAASATTRRKRDGVG